MGWQELNYLSDHPYQASVLAGRCRWELVPGFDHEYPMWDMVVCQAEQWIPIIIINNYFSMIFLLEVAFIFKVYLFVVEQE